MGLSNLPPDERERVVWVSDWISRMAEKYGGAVYDTNGKTWDWGQALCRECYGEDWNDVIAELGIETPSREDIDRERRWEAGELPDWSTNKPEVGGRDGRPI